MSVSVVYGGVGVGVPVVGVVVGHCGRVIMRAVVRLMSGVFTERKHVVLIDKKSRGPWWGKFPHTNAIEVNWSPLPPICGLKYHQSTKKYVHCLRHGILLSS